MLIGLAIVPHRLLQIFFEGLSTRWIAQQHVQPIAKWTWRAYEPTNMD